MKKIIIGLILIVGLFAQSDFTPQTNKPPIEMNRFEIVIQQIQSRALDSLGVVIPDSIIVNSQSISYIAYLYDEDGKLVKTSLTQGNLLPYMDAVEISAIQTFLDKMAAKAQILVP
ncbi:MAG: hypothetical protein V3W20_09285 [Candidatus Neomarinimicrobiota bacterium]